MMEVALEDMQWEPIGGPHLGAGEEHERLLNLLVPDHENNPHPAKRKKMTTALQVLNGRWDRTTVGHNCVQGPVTGQRCCEDEVAARENVKGAVWDLLLSCKPEVPCATRWLTVVVCTGWWTLGSVLHSIFPRAFLRAFPSAPLRALAGAPPDGHGDGDDSEDNNDSFQVKVGKRISRGRRTFQ